MSAKVAVIAGSGVRAAFHNDAILRHIPYSDIPDFHHVSAPSVAGHGSTILEVLIAGVRVNVYTGRYHLYEGHSVSTTLLPIRHIVSEGIPNVILTNAVGGLHAGLSPGDLVAPSDILDLTFAKPERFQNAPHPSFSKRDEDGLGTRSDGVNRLDGALYGKQRRSILHSEWHASLLKQSAEAGYYVHDGSYVQVMGPSYETRAEIRFLRRLGATTVGMSTAHEAIYAASRNLNVCIVSLVTNTCTDVLAKPVHHGDVLDTAASAAHRLRRVLECAIRVAPSAP